MNASTPAAYRALNGQAFAEGVRSIVPIRRDDAPSIRRWRNEQMAVLRQRARLSEADQTRYFDEVIAPSFGHPEPSLVLFSYLLGDRCIGYGGLTHIDWDARRAELSFLVQTERALDARTYPEDFGTFLRLIKRVSFEALSLERLFAETFDIRPLHVAVLERHGFELEGRMRKHVRVEGRWVDSLIHGCLRERQGC